MTRQQPQMNFRRIKSLPNWDIRSACVCVRVRVPSVLSLLPLQLSKHTHTFFLCLYSTVAVYGTGFLVSVFENGSSKNVTWHPIDDHLLAKDDDEWRFSAVQRQKLAEEYTGAETKNPTTKEAGNSGRTQEPRKR